MSKKPECVELSFSQLGLAGAMMAELQMENMEQRVKELEEFAREVAAGPYPDSDLASLLETLQKRAAALIRPTSR